MDVEILTIKEVADYLKLTEKTAYRLVAAGKLPGFKVGGRGGSAGMKSKS